MIRFKFMARRGVSNCACCPQIYIAWWNYESVLCVPGKCASRMQERGCKAAFEFFSFGISPLSGGNLSFLKIFTHGGKFLELQQENCMLLNKIRNFVIHQLCYALGCRCWKSSHILLFTRIILLKLKTNFSYPLWTSSI
jgi:hypothetical protein